jgi:hypothetical protein
MATRIIQSPRSIQSPGVQITETDLTRIPNRPNTGAIRPSAAVTGFSSQGPTEQVVLVRNMAQFNTVFGLPETAAERYLSHTVEQLVSTGSDVYVTRMPYGAGGGEEDPQNFYSALAFPILPHGKTYSDAESYYLLPPKNIRLSELEYDKYVREGSVTWSTQVSSVSTISNKIFSLNRTVASALFLEIVNDLRVTDVSKVNSYFPYTTNPYKGPIVLPNQVNAYRPLSSFNIDLYFRQRVQDYIDNMVEYNIDSLTSDVTRLSSHQVGGAPVAWASVKTDLNTLSSWTAYVSSNITSLSSSISYDLNYHVQASLDALTINDSKDLYKAGMVIINDDKLTCNDMFEGFYIALADNSDDTPYTDFKSVTSIFAVASANSSTQTFSKIPEERLNFTLTESFSSVTFQSVSERIARYPNYDFSDDAFNDCLKLFVYRLNTSPYLQDAITLDYSTVEAYVGSLYSRRKQNDPRGGRLVSFNLENRVDKNINSRIRMFVNPNISETGDWLDELGRPTKKVRVSEGAKAMWCHSTYVPLSVDNTNKNIGDLKLKLDRVFQTYDLTENESRFIDIICEAGLGTINVGLSSSFQNASIASDMRGHFDDTRDVDISSLKVIPKNWRAFYQEYDVVRQAYVDIQRLFRNYANNRKNHVFVSDPLRYIFVKGKNAKTEDNRAFNFVDDILRPLNVTYAQVKRSTYMATYPNWLRRYDAGSDEFTWLPPSGFVGKVILNTRKNAPWLAPAGFNYGRISGVVDMAINPNQRQRDLLYRSSYNPIVNFPREGMVVYGQKTFINYQTAFDRLNVRNLFLWLEKTTSTILNSFVFEPNTISTRNRVVLRLAPLFERAKVREGLYDYRIVCDERNNTAESIDRNELRVALYIQPVRSAEFILADFVATRTGTDLDALIS